MRAVGDSFAQGQRSVEIDRTGRVEVSLVDDRLEGAPSARVVACLDRDTTRELLAGAERVDMDRDDRVGTDGLCLRTLELADARTWRRPRGDRCIGSEWLERVDLAGWRAGRVAREPRPCPDTFCAVEIRRGVTAYGGHHPGSTTREVAVHADGRWWCNDVRGTMPASQARAAIAWLMAGRDPTHLHGPPRETEEAALFVHVRAHSAGREGVLSRYWTSRMEERLREIERRLCGPPPPGTEP